MKIRHPYILLLLLAAGLAGSLSCKKFIDKQKQQAAQNVITNGTWRVSHYVAGDSDLTARLAGYHFKFLDNGTVNGISDSVTRTGTWSVDINTRSILSAFPATSFPVALLNHTWKITDSYDDSVAARTTTDSLQYLLELHKNP